MPKNNKQQGTVGNQAQMRDEGGAKATNPKRNMGSVQHNDQNRQSHPDQQGMPRSGGRSHSEIGRSDDDD